MTAKHIQEAWDKMRQQRDELAAQVEVMRSGLECAKDSLWNYGCARPAEEAEKILALPATAAAILRQRDARTLREAAKKFSNGMEADSAGAWVGRCLEQIADELERKNG